MKYKVEAQYKFTIGSRSFFDGLPGFNPKDIDELWILPEPLFGKRKSFLFKNPKKEKDLVLYPPFSKEEFIQYDLDKGDRVKLGKYLVPEFAKHLELTLDDLRRLGPLLERLDEQHAYQKIIYDSYLENGDFVLTPEQREKAYESYKSSRTGEALKALEERKKALIAQKREERKRRIRELRNKV